MGGGGSSRGPRQPSLPVPGRHALDSAPMDVDSGGSLPTRRSFLKSAAIVAGSAAYFGGARIYLADERWTPNRSFWVSRGLVPANPRLEGRAAADLAIIGGGVTGLSTAIHAL